MGCTSNGGNVDMLLKQTNQMRVDLRMGAGRVISFDPPLNIETPLRP
jgi:hypothetical protein